MLPLFKSPQLLPGLTDENPGGKLWVCEWTVTTDAAPLRGVYLVHGKHPIEARQIARKAVRDGVARGREFKVEVREPTLLDRMQLKFSPPSKDQQTNDEQAR
jgi:hypothetical protein